MQKALEETGAATIMITHDLGVVAGMADDILVMYAGKPVEIAKAGRPVQASLHPYTIGLLGAVPRGPFREGLPGSDGVPSEPD